MARVLNVHRRTLHASAERVGALIDTLASAGDQLWPRDQWPAIRFDRPLAVGAVGGHGPVHYFVEAFEPSVRVVFRFMAPAGFDGTHSFAVLPAGERCVLENRLEMTTWGPARLSWPLVFEPLHDALMEDALANAGRVVEGTLSRAPWPLRVRVLRQVFQARPTAAVPSSRPAAENHAGTGTRVVTP